MYRSRWRLESNRIIWDTLHKAGIDPNIYPKKFTTTQKKRLIKLVNEAYPFGVKANHPYKIWLSEVNHILGHLGIKPLKNTRPRVLIDDPRQGRFI
jgi:hypothetical protein